MATDFKIASWNVKGLNNGIKRKKILTYLKLSRVDIAFIQEMHMCKSEALKLKCSWVGKVFSSPGTDKSRGVSVLIHKAVSFTETKVITDKESRFILVYGQLLDTPIILCNIYAPNADILAFFHNLSQYLLELEGAQIVVGGDFNQILDQDLDRSLPRRGTESKSVVAIRQMTSDLGLNDIWRTMHPEGREYSFYSPPHNVYTRIDYFLISEALLLIVLSGIICLRHYKSLVLVTILLGG
uniref:exodeoxyribonuclease III n=1 Tax=Astatotilapia calliptera TaxID=8154 RepID=A0A3P8NC16_ASTCA